MLCVEIIKNKIKNDMIKSIAILVLVLSSTQLYAQIDSSTINPTIKGETNLNINDFDKTAVAPSFGNLNFFNVPKSLGPLNPADEPMVTRGGQNIYRNAAPAVAKVFHDEGGGSGVIISQDGYIVTNWHVVRGWNSVYVVLFDQTSTASKPTVLLADVIKTDPKVDLALIRLQKPPRSLKYLRYGRTPDIGTEVHAIGHPYGEDWTYTKGYISQIRAEYEWESSDTKEDGTRVVLAGHRADVIQTQTPINPGNSGGPLISESGDLIGINTFGVGRSGVNFAVAANDVREFVERKGQEFGPIVNPSLFIGGIDSNNDGQNDIWAFDMDGDESADILAYDSNYDGEVDGYNIVEFNRRGDLEIIGSIFPDEINGRIEIVWLFDVDNNGEGEYFGVDYDRDGRPDFVRAL